jgi:hypothetical protein
MPPKIGPGFDPIQAKWRDTMQAVFGTICEVMPNVGMCLFLFDQHAGQPRANYISNTGRPQTIAAIKEWISRQVQAEPHPDDIAVDRFADAMKQKLKHAREQKGRHGWEACQPEYLAKLMVEHLAKGDMRDIANFAMMIWCNAKNHPFPIQTDTENVRNEALKEAALAAKSQSAMLREQWASGARLHVSFPECSHNQGDFIADTIRAMMTSPITEFPQPARKQPGERPCGECHINPGETCDICGASHPDTPKEAT